MSTPFPYLKQTEPADQERATKLVRAFELQADEWQGDMPLWGGWAIHQAFLMGVIWARREVDQQERRR